MASLINYLSKNSKDIEVGVITENMGEGVYKAIIAGSIKRAYNTLDTSLSVGNRVLIGKLDRGKRYIMNKTGFNDNENILTISTEVFING